MNEQPAVPAQIDRDKMAAVLSLLPGLGHLYKHHYLAGISLLVGGNIITGFVSALMALGTFGLSLVLLPVLYIAVVAASAYGLEDWHGRHHYLHPWTQPRPDSTPPPPAEEG